MLLPNGAHKRQGVGLCVLREILVLWAILCFWVIQNFSNLPAKCFWEKINLAVTLLTIQFGSGRGQQEPARILSLSFPHNIDMQIERQRRPHTSVELLPTVTYSVCLSMLNYTMLTSVLRLMSLLTQQMMLQEKRSILSVQRWTGSDNFMETLVSGLGGISENIQQLYDLQMAQNSRSRTELSALSHLVC